MGDVDPVWRLDERLRALRPEPVALLGLANECAWGTMDPVLLELVRLRIASLIGNSDGLDRRSRAARDGGLSEEKIAAIPDYATSGEFSATEQTCLAFTEQCVIDVSGVSDDDRADLGTHFAADQVRGFVTALYVTECTQRLELVSRLLLGGPSPGPDLVASAAVPPAAGDVAAGLRAVLKEYQDAVMRGTDLDPVVTELVRLRCARTHDCRICKTLRLADARTAGADDEMTAKVDFYEHSDLDERTKIALRITDAFITVPGALGAGVIADARSVFSESELAELCLDITKWSTQKIHVALGTDGADALPTSAQGVSFFSFDVEGRVAGYSATLQQTPAR